MKPDVINAVVRVHSAVENEPYTFGTGFVIKRENDRHTVVTCAHVVRDIGGQVYINGLRSTTDSMGDSDDINDIAFLEFDSPSQLPCLPLSVGGKTGESVNVLGHKAISVQGRRMDSFQPLKGTLTSPGILRSRKRKKANLPVWHIATKEKLSKGYSGSPVIDSRGRVIGMMALSTLGKKGVAIGCSAFRGLSSSELTFVDSIDLDRLIWGVPSRNREFSGRENKLLEIDQFFGASIDCGPKTYVISGLGGIGKSQLAIEYAHRFLGKYDLIWWIPSETERSIFASFRELAREVGLDVGGKSDQHILKLVDNWFRKEERKWLMILDNSPCQEAIAPLIPSSR